MKSKNIGWKTFRLACVLFEKELFACFLVIVFISPVYAQYSMPSSRVITWKGNVGAKTEWATTRSTIYTTLSPSGGNDTTQIVNALSSCPAGQVVKLGAGTFKISTTIQWPKSGVSLRGSGPTQTILQIQSGFTGGLYGSIFDFYSGHGSSPDDSWSLSPSRAISSGLTKDSTQIVTSVAHGWVAGDYVLIDQTNEASGDPPWYINGYYGNCTWCSRSNGARLKSQVVHITSVPNSTTANFEPPLYDAYSTSYSPQGVKHTGFVKDISIESMKIDNSGYYAPVGAISYGLYNSVFYDIDFDGIKYLSKSRMLWLYNTSFSTIRKCTFRNAQSSATNNGYGIFLGYGCSANLIEDNIFHDLVLGIGSEGANSGNVIAYNYATNPLPINGDTTINSFTIMGHGAGSWYNLYEGNIIANSKFRVDAGFGSQHRFTLFRNRISQKMTVVSNGRADVDIELQNYYFNLIGNVFGYAGYEDTNKCYNSGPCVSTVKSIYRIGYNRPYDNNLPGDTLVETTMLRHRNYDYVTNAAKNCNDSGEPGCQGGGSDTALPDSLYLSAKPSWYGGCTWPPVDPNGPVVSNIPAKLRYEGSSCPPVDAQPPAPPQRLR